jgi:hypothetical protein
MRIEGDKAFIDDIELPYAHVNSYEHDVPEMAHSIFNPMRFRQVLVEFPNGWALSIVYGSGTYSSNSWRFNIGAAAEAPFTETPDQVEVMGWHRSDSPYGQLGDPVGYLAVGRVAGLIANMAKWGPPAGIHQHLWSALTDG